MFVKVSELSELSTFVGYLCCLGVLLQFVQLRVTGLDKVFQDHMVV